MSRIAPFKMMNLLHGSLPNTQIMGLGVSEGRDSAKSSVKCFNAAMRFGNVKICG